MKGLIAILIYLSGCFASYQVVKMDTMRYNKYLNERFSDLPPKALWQVGDRQMALVLSVCSWITAGTIYVHYLVDNPYKKENKEAEAKW